MSKRIFSAKTEFSKRKFTNNSEGDNPHCRRDQPRRRYFSSPSPNGRQFIINQRFMARGHPVFLATSGLFTPIRTIFYVFFIFVIGLTVVQSDSNHPPEVHNLVVEQRYGTRLVDITFDLVDPDGDILSVEVEASEDDGATWTITPQTLSGDVGEGIEPGNGKHIVWDVGADVPGVINPNFRIRLIVDDGQGLDEEITWEKDGAKMRLIPAGEFEMGDHFNEDGSDERPVHTVYTDAFYMDVKEVTVGQYKKFISETGHRALPSWVSTYSPTDNHPVVGVSWNDAKAYCDWAGKRLPTEAEWERAARGGLVGKRYPWGDSISHDDANYWGTGGKDQWSESTAPVGSFSPNGYGLYDMAGNVWEWCADWYGSNYYSSSPRENPRGPSTGSSRVLRGGSWFRYASRMRAAERSNYPPSGMFAYYGFRCVSQDVTP